MAEFYLVFGVELWRGLRFTEFELVRSLPFARRWGFRGKPLGMIFSRRRSSTNKRSSKLVERVVRRWVTGNRGARRTPW